MVGSGLIGVDRPTRAGKVFLMHPGGPAAGTAAIIYCDVFHIVGCRETRQQILCMTFGIHNTIERDSNNCFHVVLVNIQWRSYFCEENVGIVWSVCCTLRHLRWPSGEVFPPGVLGTLGSFLSISCDSLPTSGLEIGTLVPGHCRISARTGLPGIL